MSEAALTSEPATPTASPAIGRFEFIPGSLAHGPVVAQWVLLGLRYRDFSLPTAANPSISTGGLCGESKSAIFGLAGPVARAAIAPWVALETGADDLARAEAAMASARLSPPVVVKPDIGCNGAGVRLVRTRAALAEALAAFPRDVVVLLQHFCPAPREAGLFYMRHPDDARGRLTSLTLKEPPVVVGDGRRSLAALIAADPRHARLSPKYGTQLRRRLAEVPAAGEAVPLVFTGNHCKGSVFRDGTALITPELTAAVDAIAQDIDGFHFGRLDVRFRCLAELRQGSGFTIIEVNGTGSEPIHIWDPEMPLWRIWADQLAHYGAAWRIGAALRARGVRSAGLAAMWRDWRRQKLLMASYPAHD